MRKLFAILVVACATLMVSCNSVESKANYYAEKLANAVDSETMEAILEAEIDKYIGGLTVEEALLFEELLEIKYEAIMEKKLKNEMKDLYDEAESYVKGAKTKKGGALPKVYSNCYDGYLNVRSAPTTNSTILGELRNGPEGAELLGVEGKWSKVRVKGVVGYVSSNYLQSTPTDPVHINAAEVVGKWSDGYQTCTIKDNGKFVHVLGSMVNESGTWHLSRNKIVLKYSDGTVISCVVKGKTLNIDGSEYRKN